MEGLIALSLQSAGFRTSALAERVQNILDDTSYSATRAAYDLRKLRAKGLVSRIPRSRRYQIQAEGLRAMAALLVLRDKIIQPVLAGAGRPRLRRPPSNPCPVDQQYRVLHKEMRSLFQIVGIAA